MVSQEITKMDWDTFAERASGKKVLLMYPWTNYRNLFLTHLLKLVDTGLLYYRISDETNRLAIWVTAMAAELGEVLDGFGTQLQAALTAQSKPAALGEALAADLSAFAGGEKVGA